MQIAEHIARLRTDPVNVALPFKAHQILVGGKGLLIEQKLSAIRGENFVAIAEQFLKICFLRSLLNRQFTAKINLIFPVIKRMVFVEERK